MGAKPDVPRNVRTRSRIKSADQTRRIPSERIGVRLGLCGRSADSSDMNNAMAQFERLWANLLGLGAKRLAALAAWQVLGA